MSILLHLIIFSIGYFVCHVGTGEISAHRRSLALPHTTALLTSMGSGMFILKVRFNFLCHFCSCSFYYIQLLFWLCTSLTWRERWKLRPQTEFGHPLPSQPCHYWEAAAGLSWGWLVSFFPFFSSCFFSCILFLFLLNTHCSVMGRPPTEFGDLLSSWPCHHWEAACSFWG